MESLHSLCSITFIFIKMLPAKWSFFTERWQLISSLVTDLIITMQKTLIAAVFCKKGLRGLFPSALCFSALASFSLFFYFSPVSGIKCTMLMFQQEVEGWRYRREGCQVSNRSVCSVESFKFLAFALLENKDLKWLHVLFFFFVCWGKKKGRSTIKSVALTLCQNKRQSPEPPNNGSEIHM